MYRGGSGNGWICKGVGVGGLYLYRGGSGRCSISIGAGDGRVVYVKGQERDKLSLRMGGRRGVVFVQGL